MMKLSFINNIKDAVTSKNAKPRSKMKKIILTKIK